MRFMNYKALFRFLSWKFMKQLNSSGRKYVIHTYRTPEILENKISYINNIFLYKILCSCLYLNAKY